jgi:hypothetical protein
MLVSYFQLGQHIRCVPIIHGRGIFAQEVRRLFLAESYDCVAVELPLSLGPTVIEAIAYLPLVTAVVYQEQAGEYCYVPVEPGEAIIEAIRLAHEERRPIEFVDMDTESFPVVRPTLPDEYTISHVGLEKYYETVLPLLPPSEAGSIQERREAWMARQLNSLDKKYKKILFVCGMAHLEGIRRHFAKPPRVKPDKVEYSPCIYAVNPDSLYLVMGEIPYIIYLYEKSRYALEIDTFDKTDSIKELLLETRKEFCHDFPEEIERLSPASMQITLNYLRNLCLMQGRLTPAMYDLVVAAQGVGGGGFGAKLVEMAKFYPYQIAENDLPWLSMGMGTAWIEPFGEVSIKNRLPGPPFSLKNIRLERLPKKEKKQKWKRHWGAHSECSWPEEDERIENFTAHVRQRAMGLVGEDQSKVEKFVSSIKDGLDIRETLRQWHTGEIYVKEQPPARGEVGAVVFIFDSNTNKYPWRSTWLAEHQNESTLCFYATDYAEDMVGPGIGRAFYGGALFIFPPIAIPNIWTDPQFKTAKNEMHLLTAASLTYSQTPYVAYVAKERPDLEMRSVARRLKRHLIYLPISNFSAYTLRKLRKFHVLQGHHIRSYARQYIR